MTQNRKMILGLYWEILAINWCKRCDIGANGVTPAANGGTLGGCCVTLGANGLTTGANGLMNG